MSNTKKLYDLIEFPAARGKNGELLMIQGSNIGIGKNKLPFPIKKVLVIKNMKMGDVRGGHTHHRTKQILFAISGSCTVELDNGSKKGRVKLKAFNKGIVLYPYVWHWMRDFSSDAVLLVLADTAYNEKDYIRNYEDFIQRS